MNGEGCTDPVILNLWYPLAAIVELRPDISYQTVLLEVEVGFGVTVDGALVAWRLDCVFIPAGKPLPSKNFTDKLLVKSAYGYFWTSLSSQPKELFSIPETDEPDRRNLNAGSIGVATSAPRAVENFLDMGHFPFVHAGVLGAEPHTEVVDYNVEIKDGELVATGCKFPQPQAAPGSVGAIVTDYIYRVPNPYCVLLYKTGAFDEARLDVIGLFIQPMTQESIRAHAFLSVLDEVTTDTELKRFQLGVFSQDKPILENQVPKRLPLSTTAETPIRADKSSITYRRWLSDLGVTYGVISAN
ncbi:MAG: aromatic ring-hydroxylating dioxygenase subunit alpha [Acidimicrobiaceae bacterium]|nr:aromatic ring-hydroxylating dioxygenase subunit alpha [Acidimicrobiaceae bacterium]